MKFPQPLERGVLVQRYKRFFADVVLDDGTVTSQVKRIRAKFVGADPDFDAIQTVYGMGYRWQSH